MIEKILKSVLVIHIIIGQSLGADYLETKPDYIKTCQRKYPDPEFVPCSTETIQGLFKSFAKGIDGLDTTIDPIKIKKLRIFTGDGPVSLKASLSKAVVTGFANAVVVRSYVSPVDYSWEANIRVPKLRIEGNYHTEGRILLLPLSGNGKCWMEPYNMDITLYTKPKLYEKFGHIFYNVTKTRVTFNMTDLKVHFDNLFGGIEVLGDNTNAYLNENWKEVSEIFKPSMKQTIEDILLDLLNKIFNYIPADYLISDIPHPSELYGTKHK